MANIERDLEESDAVLDAPGHNSLEFWQKKQRELVTSVVDYNLLTLTQLVETKRIDTSPAYQRRFRWDTNRQSKLIESFLINVPVPPIFLNEDEYGVFSIIDGKQRLSAVCEFFRGRLKLRGLELFQDLNGSTIDDLPLKLRSILETRPTLRAVIVLRQSDPDIKYEVFQRLNTGGVRLNAQEIRNSAFPGPLNDLILELSEHPRFHRLLGIKKKAQSAIWQEMRDAEFVLRYFTFCNTWRVFEGGMKRTMDNFMELQQHADKQTISELRDDFLASLAAVEGAFGDTAFRRWVPEKNSWRRQVLASLFDAEMFACRGIAASKLEEHRALIQNRFQELFSDEDFREAIDAATNTPKLFRRRIKKVRAIVKI